MISKLKNQPKEQTKERKSGLKNMKNTKVDHFHHSGTQTQSRWNLYSKVKEILQEGRSYNLITNLGATLRWNQVKLRPLYEVTSDESSDEEETDSIHENSETSDPDVHGPLSSETRDDVHLPLSPASEVHDAVNQTRRSTRALPRANPAHVANS